MFSHIRSEILKLKLTKMPNSKGVTRAQFGG